MHSRLQLALRHRCTRRRSLCLRVGPAVASQRQLRPLGEGPGAQGRAPFPQAPPFSALSPRLCSGLCPTCAFLLHPLPPLLHLPAWHSSPRPISFRAQPTQHRPAPLLTSRAPGSLGCRLQGVVHPSLWHLGTPIRLRCWLAGGRSQAGAQVRRRRRAVVRGGGWRASAVPPLTF